MSLLESLLQQGESLLHAARWGEAEQKFSEALELERNVDRAAHGLGVIAVQKSDPSRAYEWFSLACQWNPSNRAFHLNLAKVASMLGRFEEARKLLDEIVASEPENYDAWIDLGNVSRQLGDLSRALFCYDEALRINPRSAVACFNRAIISQDQRDWSTAREWFQRAIGLDTSFAEAYHNLGNIHYEMGEMSSAIEAFRQAIAIRPSYAESFNNLGNAWLALDRLDEATEAYRRSLELSPNRPELCFNLASLYEKQHRLTEAHDLYARAVALDPQATVYAGAWLTLRQNMALWEGNSELAQQICQRLLDKASPSRISKLIAPFHFLCLPVRIGVQDQYEATRLWVDETLKPIRQRWGDRGQRPIGQDRSKIRLGYLSADFHSHATSQLLAEVIEQHDRNRFEVIAYSYGKNDQSPMRARMERAFDRFVDVYKQPYAAIAARIAEDDVDILLDLKGYTLHSLPEILALRPSPIQVGFLGYPGTMAADFVDYLIADDFVIPPEHRNAYREKIVTIEGCYQPNDSQASIDATGLSRASQGLNDNAFVFCCFNNAYKVTPDIFDIWCDLLRQVPQSQFWLLSWNDLFRRNILQEARRRDIDPSRFVFAPIAPHPQHLARASLADLFLDTFPVNAHTTASDALRVGLPMVTYAGETFISRVAGSLLRELGLDELIAYSAEEYATKALRLALDRNELGRIRERLKQSLKRSKLFDGCDFARRLERSLESIIATEKNERQKTVVNADNEAELHVQAALTAAQQNDLQRAIAHNQLAIQLKPSSWTAWNNLGNIYRSTGSFEQAVQAYRRAMAIQPNSPQVLCNLGLMNQDFGYLDEAQRLLKLAIEIDTTIPELHYNLGRVYEARELFDLAEQAFRMAASLRPDFVEALNNLANCLEYQGRWKEAMEVFDAAIELDKNQLAIRVNRASLSLKHGDPLDAMRRFLDVLAIDPQHFDAAALAMQIAQSKCDWKLVDKFSAIVYKSIASGSDAFKKSRSLAPLVILGGPDEIAPPQLRQLAANALRPVAVTEILTPRRDAQRADNRIRVGYLSSDFKDHPVGRLMAALFEYHDTTRFDIFVYSAKSDPDDAVTEKLRRALPNPDHFRDVSLLSLEDTARVVAADRIDILVELNSHTDQSRIESLAWRPARIQASYLGFPGTTGSKYVDYLIADAEVIPRTEHDAYSEKIVSLPTSFLPNLPLIMSTSRKLTRSDVGLPENAFVFSGFSRPFKITARVFDCWMRLLQSVPNSVLWLRIGDETAATNLREFARNKKIDASRLIFAPPVSSELHFARQTCADLMLDTFPYNQHSTSADALRAGLPIVTLRGSSFASRVCASLLKQVGLNELIAETIEQYFEIAYQLATHPQLLKNLRDRLSAIVQAGTLCDSRQFVHEFEASLSAMWQRYEAHLPTDSIELHTAPEILYNRGNAHVRAGNWEAAKHLYRQALSLRPKFDQAQRNLARVYWLEGSRYLSSNRLDEAEVAFHIAVEIFPEFAEAHHELGCVYQQLAKPALAADAYERALRFGSPRGELAYVNQLQHIAAWDRIDAIPERIVSRLEGSGAQGEVLHPFPFMTLPLPTTPAQQMVCASRYALTLKGSSSASAFSGRRPPREKIRVGYVSSDFKSHATTWLITKLIECHRNSPVVEAFGYGLGRPDLSIDGWRIRESFREFREVGHLADFEIATLLQRDQIDIAIDLKGYTAGARPEIFAHRAAPIQASFLGYPGTMGCDFIDYLIADAFVIPDSQRSFYRERLAILPGCYQPNGTPSPMEDSRIGRERLQLPDDRFIFGCLNQTYKITRVVYRTWLEILKQVDQSVLWLLESNKQAKENLIAEAEQHGVDRSRLIFAPLVGHDEHQQRLACIDLYLDTSPVSAHTLASDVLRRGVPLLALVSDSFISRVSGSLLHTLGLERWIAFGLEEYREKAMELARQPEMLKGLRRDLVAIVSDHPLFSSQQFAAKIERAYSEMWSNFLAGRMPESFRVVDA